MLNFHILIPVICAIAMNGIMYYCFQLHKSKSTELLYLPPGYVIGIIWTVILACLGYVHYLLYSLKQKSNLGSVSIVLFILLSLSYPVINAMNVKYGYFLNLISLILAYIVGLIVLMYSKDIFVYMIPLLVWISVVNLIVLFNILYDK
jgi:tryptophan-rich sensory protein